MPNENETLADLVRYSAWASKKLADYSATVPAELLTQPIPNSHGGILKTFQHLYYSDRIWLSRVQNHTAAATDPEPGPSLKELEAEWPPILDRLAAFASVAQPDGLITFRRLTGDEYSMPAAQIIRHVVNHGTYHRGQIAAMLRQSGYAPPSTDLLFYYLAPKS